MQNGMEYEIRPMDADSVQQAYEIEIQGRNLYVQ